jgi:hypothetical protein
MAVLLAGALQAQTVVEVRLPRGLGDVVAAALRTGDGELDVRIAARAAAAPPPGALVIAIEPELQRLAAATELAQLGAIAAARGAVGRGAGDTWLLPWQLRYAIVTRSRAEGSPPGDLEALALATGLQDRLALCAPDVDPVPWLLGMQLFLEQGRAETAGFGLWTALDARAGSYANDPDAAFTALADGRADAAVLPRPLLAARGLPPGCIAAPAGPVDGVPLGFAVVSPAGSGALALAAQLAGADAARLLGGLDLAPVVLERPPLLACDVERWLAHFDQHVRGRGRSVERVADVLDYVFLALFAAVVAGYWLYQRRAQARAGGGP